jgi:UDP-N-acetylmuramate--alanine ligase
MNLNCLKSVYFLGIGGIGMSALARFFCAKGATIYGYDKTITPLTSQLIDEGMIIHFEENINAIPDKIDLIIYTPAIPENHIELQYFKNNNFEIFKRSQILGMLTQSFKGIGIAGTHGKTTISTLTAFIMNESKVGCSAFLGGISKNYQSNLILSESSNYVVIEADEFDRSFLQLTPHIASISSIDADHLDIYGDKNQLKKSFEEYISKIQKGGKLIVKKGLNLIIDNTIESYTYSLYGNSDYYTENIRIIDGCYCFDFIHPDGKIINLNMNYPGLHNIENAVVAIAIAQMTGVEEGEIRNALANFRGVNRRFDLRFKNENMIYIDDYAHHPEELKACINSIRDLYENRKITGIFQPHLFSRTRDFADDFAKSLELLDCVALLDIYPARELPIEGITSSMLLDKINSKDKFLLEKSEVIEFIKVRNPEVLLTLGAGDIDQLVEPIEKTFK